MLGYTTENHAKIADKIFAAYSKVGEIRSLAKVLGEADLSVNDIKFLEFGNAFEKQFINQGPDESRTIFQTIELASELLKILPEE